jgi:hypothetical protein
VDILSPTISYSTLCKSSKYSNSMVLWSITTRCSSELACVDQSCGGTMSALSLYLLWGCQLPLCWFWSATCRRSILPAGTNSRCWSPEFLPHAGELRRCVLLGETRKTLQERQRCGCVPQPRYQTLGTRLCETARGEGRDTGAKNAAFAVVTAVTAHPRERVAVGPTRASEWPWAITGCDPRDARRVLLLSDHLQQPS